MAAEKVCAGSARRGVVPAATALAPVTPVLITPRGLRVEGAPLDALVTLLRALG